MDLISETGWDLSQPMAEIHETYLVPSMYAQWAVRLTAMAQIDAGQRVLDVGCGTGILARKAAEEVGFTGRVTGLDLDPEMLAVARKKAPHIDWRHGDAKDLPFDDGSFDRVVSQFLLPHVKNRVALLRQMLRVLAPGGRLALAVWAPINYSPAFSALVRLIREHGNDEAAETLALPWEIGHEQKLEGFLRTSGARSFSISRERGTVRFPDPETVLELWLNRPPVRPLLDDHSFETIVQHGREELAGFRVPAGGLVCPMDAMAVIVDKS